MNIQQKPSNSAPNRTNSDIVESASVTALMRYLMSKESGLARNPDYLGNIFVNGKWAAHLKDPDAAQANFHKQLPGIIYYHLIRTKHFDFSMLEWVKKNPDSQVVILGAGYDSRPIRFKEVLNKANIKIYEVDLNALLDYKQSVIKNKLGEKLDHVTYVSCNFQNEDIIDRLVSNGFDQTKNTFILWEGVTYFLTEENIRHYLTLLRNNITDSLQITFDYDFRDFVNGDVSYYGGPELYKLTTDDLGEPHLFGLNYNEVEEYIENLGYQLKSNYTSFMLESLYLRDNSGKSVGTPHGFVGIAEIVI